MSTTGLGCVGMKGQTKPLMTGLSVWPWARHSTSLCLSFFSCKVKIIISLSHMIGGRNKELTYVKCLAQCLELSGNSIVFFLIEV